MESWNQFANGGAALRTDNRTDVHLRGHQANLLASERVNCISLHSKGNSYFINQTLKAGAQVEKLARF